jgi:hypothetical protein
MSIYQKSYSIYSLKYNNYENLHLFSRKSILKNNNFNNYYYSLKYWLFNCFYKCNIENDNNNDNDNDNNNNNSKKMKKILK